LPPKDDLRETPVRERISRVCVQARQEYFSIAELAQRWRCSRGTVYNRLRALAAEILDFAPRGKKGKKVVRAQTVLQIEERKTRRLL
jgi:DNA-binding transcriptional MocR family regulator